MSTKYPGGIITKSPATPTGPFGNGAAPGIWTLDQQAAYLKQGVWPIAGNYPLYIQDVFAVTTYTGNNGTLPIVNGINLSDYGGMTWLKSRTYGGGGNHQITDTVRGINAIIKPNLTDATATASGNNLVSFNTTGFTLGSGFSGYSNFSGSNNVVWTFRKQPKFFDIVTYTGNGTAGRTVAHNLGATPGCIIVKNITASSIWSVYHRSQGATKVGILNGSNSFATSSAYWNDTAPTNTVFSLGAAGAVNDSGQTYVAYLFAHDAGGFGLTGTENAISCGTYTGNGAVGGQLINLGYEAQWVIIKNVGSGYNWWMLDTTRGWTINGDYGGDAALYCDSDVAEQNQVGGEPAPTGFRAIQDNVNQSGQTYIYIVIRKTM